MSSEFKRHGAYFSKNKQFLFFQAQFNSIFDPESIVLFDPKEELVQEGDRTLQVVDSSTCKLNFEMMSALREMMLRIAEKCSVQKSLESVLSERSALTDELQKTGKGCQELKNERNLLTENTETKKKLDQQQETWKENAAKENKDGLNKVEILIVFDN